MTLYLVRHLPTSWNIEGRLQGTKDISISRPLTFESLKQIKNNKAILSKIKFDAVFASEKKRTIETALEYGFSKPIISSLLNELDFGPFEGILRTDAIEKMGGDFINNPFKTVLGNNYRNLEKDIRTFLTSNQGQQNILVFGHGTFIRGVKSFVETGNILGINAFPLANNEIVKLDVLTSEC